MEPGDGWAPPSQQLRFYTVLLSQYPDGFARPLKHGNNEPTPTNVPYDVTENPNGLTNPIYVWRYLICKYGVQVCGLGDGEAKRDRRRDRHRGRDGETTSVAF